MAPATKAPAFKAAMLAMLEAAFAGDPEARVCYGLPDDLLSADYVMLGSTKTAWTRAVTRNTAPSRAADLQLIVVISARVFGGEEAQQPATERAFALLDVIDAALDADPTVGGVVRDVELDEAEHAEDLAYTADGALVVGRLADITLTIQAKTRV